MPDGYGNTRRFTKPRDDFAGSCTRAGNARPYAACANFAAVFGFCKCLHAATARRGPTDRCVNRCTPWPYGCGGLFWKMRKHRARWFSRRADVGIGPYAEFAHFPTGTAVALWTESTNRMHRCASDLLSKPVRFSRRRGSSRRNWYACCFRRRSLRCSSAARAAKPYGTGTRHGRSSDGSCPCGRSWPRTASDGRS